MTGSLRPRRRFVVPATLLVVLVGALLGITFFGSWWFRPSTERAATALGWVLAWAVTAVGILVSSVLLVLESVRRRARWLWLLVLPLVLVSLCLAWAARLESYGPTSDPDDQTVVWPFTLDR